MVYLIDYLHSRGIVYRNLKPENIYIDRNGFLKVCDFELAKVLPEGNKTYTVCGTPEYMAPEMLTGTGYSFPVDYWALGVLLYEFLVGIDPFSAETPFLTYRNILEKRVKFPKDTDPAAINLIKHLLDKDAFKRLGSSKGGAKDVMGHKFFKDVNFNDIKDLKDFGKFPIYKPPFANSNDTQNYDEFPQEPADAPKPPAIPKEEDPFEKWNK